MFLLKSAERSFRLGFLMKILFQNGAGVPVCFVPKKGSFFLDLHMGFRLAVPLVGRLLVHFANPLKLNKSMQTVSFKWMMLKLDLLRSLRLQ